MAASFVIDSSIQHQPIQPLQPIQTSTTSSLSATSAFHGGGVGAGVPGGRRGWGSPYGYYGGYGSGGYGSGYGYGDNSGSRVAELQSRLASAGYYHGTIDGILGPATRRAIRAYERDHGYAS